ncbi:MAG TPA: PLP-dependent aminotransferase family protein [Candidatus Solibacter sp.]|nr:PLP-dependent aminotransferase family protein [Candidatus Solibacter sp.]
MPKLPSSTSPLISIDRKAEAPLYRQIYDAYRVAILNRNLRAGHRVPSTRALASELGISRIPVLNAYAQLLAEGYFESRIGAGTIVSNSLPDDEALSHTGGRVSIGRSRPRLISRDCSNLPAAETALQWLGARHGAFTVGQPALDQFPIKIWSSLVVRHSRKLHPKSLYYGGPMGSRRLREEIATYLRASRGVRCEAEQIMIVSGSQQALDICARVLLNRGDSVWMEEPGYRFARSVLILNGCRLIPVPVDAEGLSVSQGIQACRKARAAIVTPSHQYPLGVTMSAARRMQLLDWARNSSAWIIEDDYDSEFRYDSMPIVSLQGLDRHSRVIYIGTFSKVLFPSLRLGYLVIPPDLVEPFVRIRLAMDIAPSAFNQSVLSDFIQEGHFSRHIRRMRIVYRERRNALLEQIQNELASDVEVSGGQAGLHLSVSLKRRSSDIELAKRAAVRELWLAPLSPSYLERAMRRGFILGFGNVAAQEMPAGVRALRQLLRSRQETVPTRHPEDVAHPAEPR